MILTLSKLNENQKPKAGLEIRSHHVSFAKPHRRLQVEFSQWPMPAAPHNSPAP